jgi:hypothetical protein
VHVYVYGTQVKLERKDHLTLFVFSLLFNVNIWLSNYSLNLVTMAMHQVVRAMVPAFTVMLSVPLLGKRYEHIPQCMLLQRTHARTFHSYKPRHHLCFLRLLIALHFALLVILLLSLHLAVLV